MKIQEIENYLLNKKKATATFPFGPDALVFKVANKMFALISINEKPLRINLKCEPDNAIALRSMFKSIIPGYHMNKEHWNTIILDGSIPNELIFEMIDSSYDLVVLKLNKNDRDKIPQTNS